MLEEGKVPSTDEGEVRRDKEPPDAVFDERGVAERGEDGVGRPRRRSRARRTVAKEASARPRSFTPEQRLMLLDVWQRSELPASDFSELAGVSPHSLYTWKKKFDAEGPAGLVGLKRGRPKGSRLPEPTKRAILMLKRSYPDWGRQRIHDELVRAEGLEASPGAIGKVLSNAGYVVEEAATKPHAPPVKRFERARPNQLWQSDLFTFLLRRQNRRVYLVAFLDDCSRFVVGHALSASASGVFVRDCFEAAVANHGLPEEVLTDRGPQYAVWRGTSAFTKLLVRRGVKHRLSRPRHPETVGKTERMWKTLWEELLREAVFKDLEDARARIHSWFDHYNFSRPHQALDGLVPADRFFQAAPERKRALKERVEENALEIARGGAPRKPFYLAGRVGDQPISLHAEGDKVVLIREDGRREEVDLVATGWRDRPLGEPPKDVAMETGVEALASALSQRDLEKRRVEASGSEEGSEDHGSEAKDIEHGAQDAGEQQRGDGEPGGDADGGGDPGDALGALEPDGDERGAGGECEPLLPAGGAGAAGAGDGDGAEAQGEDADTGAGARPAEGGERSTSKGDASLPGAGSHGAAHDRACEAEAFCGRIEEGASAADAGEDGAEDAAAEGGAGGDDDDTGEGVSEAPDAPPGRGDPALQARPGKRDAVIGEGGQGGSMRPEPRRT